MAGSHLTFVYYLALPLLSSCYKNLTLFWELLHALSLLAVNELHYESCVRESQARAWLVGFAHSMY
jgi:hypothetical protein